VSPGEELGGKYRIEGVVGMGAMGVVVRAWHIELEQQVAVKFLFPEFARNSDGAERFRREARAAAKIKNQHVARVLDVGMLEDKSIPYIVMEYLEGRDLARRLSEDGPLPVPQAVRYVMQACEAVSEAHGRGIVHRDLKPANLFLAEGQHGAAIIKVLDFGISKVSGGAQQFSLTDTATLMGSPAYMSPEQLESSRDVDARADIWSLGVILHELILGEVPFNGDSVPQLVRSILAGTRKTLLDRDSGLDGLESVVARALAQDRELRFQNVEELREALEPFADGPRGTGFGASMLTSREHGDPDQGGRKHAVATPHAATPQVATPHAATPHAGSAGATTDPGPGAAPPELTEAGGAGVASAWGNTQRGRHRSWQRHAIPVALVLAGLGILGYWATTTFLEPPAAFTPTSPERPVALPAAAHPVEHQAASAAAPATVTLPAAAEPHGAPEGTPIVRVVTSGTENASVAAATTPATPAPTAATVPKQTRDPRPSETRAATLESLPVPVASPPAGTGKSAAEAAASSDKPKSDTSQRGGLDVPDFGGRE